MGFGIFDVLGQSFGSKSDLYGSKPIVPAAPDYVASLKKTVQGDINLLPSVSELATKSTKLYSDLMEAGTPGINALRDKTTGVIDDWLSGKVPKDVQRQLSIFGAERASQTGVGGSIGDSWTAQDFGNTSFAIQQQGVSAASRWLEQSRGGIFDFSKMFYGPQEAMQQADANFNRDWLSAQVAAAPDPQKRGAFDTEMGGFGMLLGMYGGNAYTNQYKPIYGGGGGGGGGGPGSSGPGDSNSQYMAGNSSFFDQQNDMVNPTYVWPSGGGGTGTGGGSTGGQEGPSIFDVF